MSQCPNACQINRQNVKRYARQNAKENKQFIYITFFNIQSDLLAYILTVLAFHVAFYLTTGVAFFLTFDLAFIRHPIYIYMAFYLACYLAFYLAFYVTYIICRIYIYIHIHVYIYIYLYIWLNYNISQVIGSILLFQN